MISMRAIRFDIRNNKALLCAAALVCAVGTAQAEWVRSSSVTDSAVNNGDGSWTYAYTLNNTSAGGSDDSTPLIVDWELPWFADMGIRDVVSPYGWNWAIETIGVVNNATGWAGVAAWQNPSDPWYSGGTSPYTTGTQVLHWYNACFNGETVGCEWNLQGAIWPEGSLTGFGFTASYAPTAAPYQASWVLSPVLTGDPLFPSAGVPGSPSVTNQQPGQVPEPGILALIGLAGLAGALARRRR